MRVKMMSGDTLKITEEESNNIKGKSGLTFVPSLGGLLNLSSVESVLPDEAITNKNEGWLHDGTKVIKQFGIWVDAKNPEVRLSYEHYPELAKDEVFSFDPKLGITAKQLENYTEKLKPSEYGGI
jgi:hypothetical protein